MHYACNTAAMDVAGSLNNYLLKEQFGGKVFDCKILKYFNLISRISKIFLKFTFEVKKNI